MKDLFDARYEAVKIAHEDLINKKINPFCPEMVFLNGIKTL